MAYGDNAYRLIMGLLEAKKISLATIASAACRTVPEIDATIARTPHPVLAPNVRKTICDEINKRIPISVEDAFLNAEKLRAKFPGVFSEL